MFRFMRCKHENCEISIEQIMEYSINIRDGEPDPYGDIEPQNSGKIYVYCEDCFLEHTYPSARYYPKWLIKYMDNAEVEMDLRAGVKHANL